MVTLTIPTPADLRFKATVLSHGWYQLAPHQYDETGNCLMRKLRLPDGLIVNLMIQGSRSKALQVTVESRGVITSLQRYAITRAVRHMFNLDVNLRDFYQLMRKTEGYEWVDEHKAARLLASPTIWEDLAKTLTTTNISWSGTKEMTRKLVSLDPDGVFPTPQLIAAMTADDLTEQTGMGYRAPYLHTLATKIVNGEVDVESWRRLDSDAFYKAVMHIKGFGDYAAGTMLRLCGHFDKLAIDTVARNAYEQITGTKPESDTDIRTHYEPYGKWRGLVLWMDCIREDYQPTPA